MITKNLVIPTIAVGLTMWVISGLWHHLILAMFYANEAKATHEGIGVLLIAYVILALFMASLYPRSFQGGSPAIEG